MENNHCFVVNKVLAVKYKYLISYFKSLAFNLLNGINTMWHIYLRIDIQLKV